MPTISLKRNTSINRLQNRADYKLDKDNFDVVSVYRDNFISAVNRVDNKCIITNAL